MIRWELKLLWRCGACKSVGRYLSPQRGPPSCEPAPRSPRVRCVAASDCGVLNARGIATARGGRWYAKSVSNVFARSA
jgi:hypothetical protein